MTLQKSDDLWLRVCKHERLRPDRGVAVLLGDDQVALFLLSSTALGKQKSSANEHKVYAVDNHDPFSEANVISRGIVGSFGDRVYVASPMHKQRFDLRSGACLDDPTVSLRVWQVRLINGWIEVLTSDEPLTRDIEVMT